MPSTSVWIVHEALHMLVLLRNAIVMHGYPSVRCFTNSEEVLALFKQGQRPDVIIAEDSLTGMSGNDLLNMVANLCETCHGILLVSPDVDPFASRHQTVVKGSTGLHESLVQAIHLAAHAGYINPLIKEVIRYGTETDQPQGISA